VTAELAGGGQPAVVTARASGIGRWWQTLRTLKRRYDPSGLFRDNFFIDPTTVGTAV
jgi:FAD/FMN-containing dehydrogenase